MAAAAAAAAVVGFEGRRWKEAMGVPETQPSAAVGAEIIVAGFTCAVRYSAGLAQLTIFMCFADSHLADPKSLALQHSLLEYAKPGCSSQSCKVARC